MTHRFADRILRYFRSPKRAERASLVASAEKLFAMGDFEGALSGYMKAACHSAPSALEHLRMGECHLASGRRAEALYEFISAMKSDPGDHRSRLAAAGIHLFEGRCRAALDLLSAELPEGPDKALGFVISGKCFLALGDFEGACRELSRAISRGASDAGTLCAMGAAIMFGTPEDGKRASEFFTRAVRAFPDMAEGYFWSAWHLLSSGRRKRAASVISSCGEKCGRGFFYYLTLGDGALSEGMIAEAREFYEKASNEPFPAVYHSGLHSLRMAWLCCRAGDVATGASWFEKAFSSADHGPEASLAAAVLAGFQPEAGPGLGDCISRNAGYAALALYDIASAIASARRASASGDHRAAAAALAAFAGRSSPHDGVTSSASSRAVSEARLLLAEALAALGDLEGARRALGQVSTDPSSFRPFFYEDPAIFPQRALELFRLTLKGPSPGREESSSVRSGSVTGPSVRLRDALSSISSALADPCVPDEFRNAAASIASDLERPVNIAVVGEFNTGKSTLINAMIGEAVAPMGIEPVTAVINVFKYSYDRAVRIIAAGGEFTARFDRLAEFVDERSADPSFISSIDRVEIYHPSPLLKNINIIDTPGLNSPSPRHEFLTRDLLDRADAVIWLFDAMGAGKSSERRAYESAGIASKKTVFVLNKTDLMDASGVAQVASFLRSWLGPAARICPVSAKRTLSSLLKDPSSQPDADFSSLMSAISDEVLSNGTAVKEFAALDRAAKLVSSLKEYAAAEEAGAARSAASANALLSLAGVRNPAFESVFEKEVLECVPAVTEAVRDHMSEHLGRLVSVKKGVFLDGYSVHFPDVDIFLDGASKFLASRIDRPVSIFISKFSAYLDSWHREWLASFSAGPPSAEEESPHTVFSGYRNGILSSARDAMVNSNALFFEGYIRGRLTALIGERGCSHARKYPGRTAMELVPDIRSALISSFAAWRTQASRSMKAFADGEIAKMTVRSFALGRVVSTVSTIVSELAGR